MGNFLVIVGLEPDEFLSLIKKLCRMLFFGCQVCSKANQPAAFLKEKKWSCLVNSGIFSHSNDIPMGRSGRKSPLYTGWLLGSIAPTINKPLLTCRIGSIHGKSGWQHINSQMQMRNYIGRLYSYTQHLGIWGKNTAYKKGPHHCHHVWWKVLKWY